MTADDLPNLVRLLDRRNINFVALVTLRHALADLGLATRGEQDLLLRSARRAGLVSLAALEGRHGTTPQERAACIPDGETLLGFVMVRA